MNEYNKLKQTYDIYIYKTKKTKINSEFTFLG